MVDIAVLHDSKSCSCGIESQYFKILGRVGTDKVRSCAIAANEYRDNIFNLLREHKGHLQTVGLSCNSDDLEKLLKNFYAARINRMTHCGFMSSNYGCEPHDGGYV
jgi:hypothetical protein